MNLSYDSAMSELQGIVDDLEKEVIGMDQLSHKVKRATELLTHCKEKLRVVEGDMKDLFE